VVLLTAVAGLATFGCTRIILASVKGRPEVSSVDLPAVSPAARPHEEEWKHYEFVSTQLADYYKMYMTAWSIVGTGVFVGVVFGQGAVAALGTVIVCVIPFILLFCFLLTSWFWAYFATYRVYLKCLEDCLPGDNRPGLHKVKIRDDGTERWTVVVGSLIYLAFASSASFLVAKDCGHPLLMFLAMAAVYVVFAVLAGLTAKDMVEHAKRPTRDQLRRRRKCRAKRRRNGMPASSPARIS